MESTQVNFKQAPTPTPYERVDLNEILKSAMEAAEGETPFYLYFESEIKKQINLLKEGFGPETTIRFAMKACSNAEILRIFSNHGLSFDCSSVYEVERVLRAGIRPEKIELVTQELTSKSLAYLEKLPGHENIKLIANSKYQLQVLAESKFKPQIQGIRINPGQGSGYGKKTTVSGPGYSFGIWHKQIDEIIELADKLGVKIKKLHSHIGAGTDPNNWLDIADTQLDFIKTKFKDVDTVDLGGGFKIARTNKDLETNVVLLGQHVIERVEKFRNETGRELRLEIEPGTFLSANVGLLVCEVVDIVDTFNRDNSQSQIDEERGHLFVKVNSGLNDLTRPSLYGAQHDLKVVKIDQESQQD